MVTSVSIAQHTFVPPTATQLANAYALVDRFAKVWSKPDLDGLRSLMHADTQNLIPPMTEPADREGVLVHFGQTLKQLPDLRIEVVRWAPTGHSVMIEWRATATVAGTPLSWTGVDRFGVRGERMFEAHVYWDTRRVAETFAEAAKVAQAGAG